MASSFHAVQDAAADSIRALFTYLFMYLYPSRLNRACPTPGGEEADLFLGLGGPLTPTYPLCRASEEDRREQTRERGYLAKVDVLFGRH